METTKVYSDLLRAYINPDVRIIALKGSTRSSKTYSTLQLLNSIAAKSTVPRLISVVSETMPHLKRGAIRDFQNILKTDEMFDRDAWHDTDKMYSYANGQIEFFSADQPSKVMGPAREVLYMNECINMEYEVYRQLSVRTTEKVILDYNPAHEFWVDSKILHRKDAVMIHSTYKDNDMLTASQVAEIESNKDIDPEWWNVYGLGLTGSREGLVWKNWDIVANMPDRRLWKDAWIGVDFGWSAPSAVMLIVLSEGEIYIDEIAYGPHMENKDIAKAILEAGLEKLEVICDKAEPKSIKELKNYGIKRAIPSDNKDIKLGIQVVNRFKKHYTARSINSIDENRKYRYPKDPHTEQYLDIPIKLHGHAKDAERYVFLNRLSHARSSWDIRTSKSSRRAA